jgi:hypothetical protein
MAAQSVKIEGRSLKTQGGNSDPVIERKCRRVDRRFRQIRRMAAPNVAKEPSPVCPTTPSIYEERTTNMSITQLTERVSAQAEQIPAR